QRLGWSFDQRRSRALLASGVVGTEKVLLAKPQTYMNESGVAGGETARLFQLTPANHPLGGFDQPGLPPRQLRLRPRRAAGGQGLEPTTRHLATSDFARLKIGIGRPPSGRWENVDFLLNQPRGDERIALDVAIERAADAATAWLAEGIDAAMNRFNNDGNAKK